MIHTNNFIKNKFGFFFYKSSFLKYSTYSFLRNNINLPEADEQDLKILEIASECGKSQKNSWSVVQSIKYIFENNIEGDFVESGVYKGDSLIIFELTQRKYNLKKKIYGFDTFEGMVKPGDFDLFINKSVKFTALHYYKTNPNWMRASLELVVKNLKYYLDNIYNITLIKGDVRKTMLDENNLPNKISLLRLDTDFYESTKMELETLYPRLSKGGILIVDDYGFFSGSKKAVDEYLKNEKLILFPVDDHVRICIKK